MGSRSSSKSGSRNASKFESEKGELKGPERFFYDKGTYTGVHKNGGPTTNDSLGQELSLRPNLLQGATFVKNNGHPLDDNITFSSPSRCSSRSSSKSESRNASKNDGDKGGLNDHQLATKRASSLPSLSRSPK